MAGQPHLVSEYIENLDGKLLGKHQAVLEKFVAGKNGIYALYQHGRLYYVGLATDLKIRLKQHLKDQHAKKWDHFSVYLTTNWKHLKDLETILLRVHKPEGNRMKGHFIGGKDTKKELLRSFNANNKAEGLKMFGLDPKEGSIPKSVRKTITGIAYAGTPLRGFYKSAIIKARLRKDGSVRVGDSIFSSLSAAASTTTGHPTNGRWFWCVQEKKGEWVRIRDAKP